jgi:cold shock CspA family protein
MIAYVDEYGNPTDAPPDPEEKEEVDLEDIEISPPKKEDVEDLDPIRKGTITYYNDAKGFGFIRDAETKEDVFVHINNSLDDIQEGNLVSFEVEMGPKGPSAFNVKLFKE